MAFLSKYGVARTIRIPMIKFGVTGFARGSDWTPATGDVQISKDGGAFANIGTLPSAVDATTNAVVAEWAFPLTATEMQAAQIVVVVGDAVSGKAVEDQSFVIETYGHASGQHEFDLDTPISGYATSAALATVQADTDDIQARLPAALVSGRIDASVGAMATDTVTSGAVATSAVTELQTGLATSAALATVQADTDDIQTRLPAALVGGRMSSQVGAMGTDVLDAAALKADAVTEMVVGILAGGMSEVSTVPPAGPTVAQAIMLLYQALRNGGVSDNTHVTIQKDDGTTVGSASISDNTGTSTVTKGKFT